MTFPFHCTHTYSLKCSECGEVATESFDQYRGEEPKVPALPVGWMEINGILICEKHTPVLAIVSADKALMLRDFVTMLKANVVVGDPKLYSVSEIRKRRAKKKAGTK
jgi:hypothetical protein